MRHRINSKNRIEQEQEEETGGPKDHDLKDLVVVETMTLNKLTIIIRLVNQRRGWRYKQQLEDSFVVVSGYSYLPCASHAEVIRCVSNSEAEEVYTASAVALRGMPVAGTLQHTYVPLAVKLGSESPPESSQYVPLFIITYVTKKTVFHFHL